MYKEMSDKDLATHLHSESCWQGSLLAEMAEEASTRLHNLAYAQKLMADVLNEYLTSDDGTDLIPNHVRDAAMLARIGRR